MWRKNTLENQSVSTINFDWDLLFGFENDYSLVEFGGTARLGPH